jgi:hypothetical protein
MEEILSNTSKNQYYLENSVFIEEVDGLELWRLGNNEFDTFNRFIFKVYSEAFGKDGVIPFSFQDIETQSALYFNHTKICGIKSPEGFLLGTWGLILKDLNRDEFLLPLEKNYNMKTDTILTKMEAPNTRYIFNGWRTAVDKEGLEKINLPRQKSVFLFDFLLRGLTKDFSGETNQYLGISEMELLVLKYHRRIGIPWVILGDPIDYWGRDRFPCAFKMEIFEEYLRKNHPERYQFIYKD